MIMPIESVRESTIIAIIDIIDVFDVLIMLSG